MGRVAVESGNAVASAVAALAKDTEPDVRAVAAETLGKLGDDSVSTALKDVPSIIVLVY